MSIKSYKSTTTVAAEQLDEPQPRENYSDDRLRYATDATHYGDSKSVLEEAHPEMFENYGYESEFDGEHEGYYDKNKKVQRSRSILEEDAWPENELTTEEARSCLNRIGQVGNGLLYAYIQIDLDHRNFTNIEEIANFQHLSIINVLHNHLDLHALDVLRHLPYVVSVQADHNDVSSLCLSPLQYLQVLTLNSNKISSLSGLKQPSLERLELNDNKISHLIRTSDKNGSGENYCNEIDCPNLYALALTRNALESVEQFALVSVKLSVLYLSYNRIDKLNGLGDLSNLSHLHLRANRILNLDGFTENLKSLAYLNLRENRLGDVNELNKLACLKSLNTLVVSDNDFGRDPIEIKCKVLRALPWLKRIDKSPVSASELQNAAAGYNCGESGEEFVYEEE